MVQNRPKNRRGAKKNQKILKMSENLKKTAPWCKGKCTKNDQNPRSKKGENYQKIRKIGKSAVNAPAAPPPTPTTTTTMGARPLTPGGEARKNVLKMTQKKLKNRKFTNTG